MKISANTSKNVNATHLPDGCGELGGVSVFIFPNPEWRKSHNRKAP